MTRVVVDASAMAAIVFGEPEGPALVARLDGAVLFAPTLLRFELCNTAWKKARRHAGSASAILAALEAALAEDWGVVWRDIQPADVTLVALAVGCTAYDAAYLWLAGTLGAELITLDTELVRLSAVLAPS